MHAWYVVLKQKYMNIMNISGNIEEWGGHVTKWLLKSPNYGAIQSPRFGRFFSTLASSDRDDFYIISQMEQIEKAKFYWMRICVRLCVWCSRDVLNIYSKTSNNHNDSPCFLREIDYTGIHRVASRVRQRGPMAIAAWSTFYRAGFKRRCWEFMEMNFGNRVRIPSME